MKHLTYNNTIRNKMVLPNTLYFSKNPKKNFAESIEGLFNPPKAPIIRCDTRVPRDPGPHPGRTYGGSGVVIGQTISLLAI